MSKFCFKCGTPVNDGEKFCPKCGTNLGVSTSPQIQPNVNKNTNSNNITITIVINEINNSYCNCSSYHCRQWSGIFSLSKT
ncbi:zinc-ribbon domain-containing protein [Megamonas rupellensis]|uniref:zinc-ribbon domain-containing protein n=1 Tax=Megamonas rupellensis TaxID=491921 RepID=UPI003C6CF66B